ncbi:MAG: HAMP domain-containing histidine kinase [Planctomycetes bacterium]|nr:HAMP domain-containing histidine kinase [Planctomycetota bacterium]
MSQASFRWRVMMPTLLLAGLVAAALVVLVHLRTREQRRRTLENSLGTKTEEVFSVLTASDGRVELESFLELETSYQCSPYEYFYEIVAADGRLLAGSQNLASVRLDMDGVETGGGDTAALAGEEPALLVRPHPLIGPEQVLVRSQRSPAGVEYAGAVRPSVRVAVCLEPYARALSADLVNNLIAGLLALFVLAAALWFVIGRSLRSVSAITRHASAISCSNLRERLPRSGSGDELDRLSAVLNELFAGLERSLQQMEAFTSDAAHQLRTPLTRIRGELDLVLANARELAPATRERLEETRTELERLAHTCARLLLLARLDRGALASELQAEEVELTALAQELVEQVSPLAFEKGVLVSFSAAEPVRLRGCKALLAEALLNLLDNAIRCTPPRGHVAVRVGVVSVNAVERHALLEVSDTGQGIPTGAHELVFRRFYRGADGASGEGTGLGLAIVRGIARAHGGDVTLLPRTAAGASFQVRLPAA